MEDKFPEWLQKIQRVHPKSDEEVLRFIYDFSVKQGYGEAEEILYQQFASGYCYYFACMLKAAFNRGEICWAAPFGHIVWVDKNGIPYDISGVNESETDDYIPEYMMGNTINDFKHISGREYTLPERQRQVFLARYFYALPLSGIAARFSMRENTVKTTLHRTRRRLRDYLEQEELL